MTTQEALSAVETAIIDVVDEPIPGFVCVTEAYVRNREVLRCPIRMLRCPGYSSAY
jgi:hypothetical protein